MVHYYNPRLTDSKAAPHRRQGRCESHTTSTAAYNVWQPSEPTVHFLQISTMSKRSYAANDAVFRAKVFAYHR